MLGTIFYAVGCFFAAGVLATILVVLRPMRTRDETKPWKTFIGSFIFCLSAPFLYCEVLTMAFSKPMASAIQSAYDETGVNGPLRYFRLTAYSGNSAKALVVGTEHETWGGEDSTVLAFTLDKDENGKWKAESYRVLSSGRLNQDAFVFPPYY